MRLYRELCGYLREARKTLKWERRRRKELAALNTECHRAPSAHPSPAKSAPKGPVEEQGAAPAAHGERSDVETAMSGAFAESAGMPRAATIQEVMVETDRQTGDAIKELESVERELREAGYMPSGVASK